MSLVKKISFCEDISVAANRVLGQSDELIQKYTGSLAGKDNRGNPHWYYKTTFYAVAEMPGWNPLPPTRMCLADPIK
jgi:hypothetical protein